MGKVLDIMTDILIHEGTKRHSGRYPWGSGENPYQHDGDFLSRVNTLRKQGLSDDEIAKQMHMKSDSLKKQIEQSERLRKVDKDISYGTKLRRAGYPWKNKEERDQWYAKYKEYKSQKMTDAQIAEVLNGRINNEDGSFSSKEVRAYARRAYNMQRQELYDQASKLKAEGKGWTEIGKILGKPESSIRTLLQDDNAKKNMNSADVAYNYLRTQIDKKGAIDVSAGVENELGLSKEGLDQAIIMLEADGYSRYGFSQPQVTNPTQRTFVTVLSKPEITQAMAYKDPTLIKSVIDHHYDGSTGEMKKDTFQYPTSLDSKRMMVRYRDEGGLEKDGVIELRRGVEDISLGESRYAQVRILVDDTHFIKGMAMYSDDMPKGVDVIFNTNKEKGTPVLGSKDNSVLKPIKRNSDGTPAENPFGSYIKEKGQFFYTDKKGNEQLSKINMVREEGDWENWSKNLSPQFLSKQPVQLINKQLKLSYSDKQAEFNEIKELNNVTIKKHLLEEFANDCDSSAVHMKAAALPRQASKVILPMTSLKETEVYAPSYKDGESVALVRYPHAGTFEIPILKVNNSNKEGLKQIGKDSIDAIGINSKVAEKLSGADFDGDSVVVIPVNSRVKIQSTPSLKGLESFDPKVEYGTTHLSKEEKDKIKFMTDTQKEMGQVSNLITDMTIKGASYDEIARAVKHSMVVIDAEKHNLDYKRSEKENRIKELKQKYQAHINENGNVSYGASTLISQSTAEKRVPKRRGNPYINPVTGEKTWEAISYIDPKTGKKVNKPAKYAMEPEVTLRYRNKDIANNEWLSKKDFINSGGNLDTAEIKEKWEIPTQKSTRMREAKDAYELVSKYNTPQERAYADYANKLKALANEARKEKLNTDSLVRNPSAAKLYSLEVDQLKAQLNLSKSNISREREANRIANSRAEAIIKDNNIINADEKRKIRQQQLVKARVEVGAKRHPVTISDKQWEAIQAGAISENTLNEILKKTDVDALRKRATPNSGSGLSTSQIGKIKAMQASGNYTLAEIAQAVGKSVSTVSKYLRS